LEGTSRDPQSRASSKFRPEIKQLDSSASHHETRPLWGFLPRRGTALRVLVRKRRWEGDIVHFRNRDKKQLNPKACKGGRKGTEKLILGI